MKGPLSLLIACFAWLPATAMQAADQVTGDGSAIQFKRTRLDKTFRSEGIAVGDFNRDGKPDIAAGSVWYSAPNWAPHSILAEPAEFDLGGTSESFMNFADDCNQDGWCDLIVVDFPGKQTWWFENPQGEDRAWRRNMCTPVTNNESPQYVDMDGDGRRDLIMAVAPNTDDADGPERFLAILRPHADPLQPWKIQRVSAAAAPGTNRFSHGLGAGDVNGDGRIDLVVPQGWWQAPADERPEWEFHPIDFDKTVSQMVVFDFDGDGDNDVACSSAHEIGIWWLEHTPDGWQTHEIDMSFSQTHSLCLADINDDGLPDLVTGKRWWAHGPDGDVQPNYPAVLYWFELRRENGRPLWIPHQIDSDSGVGTQFEVADVDGDGLLDIVTSNKKGVHFFQQARTDVSVKP